MPWASGPKARRLSACQRPKSETARQARPAARRQKKAGSAGRMGGAGAKTDGTGTSGGVVARDFVNGRGPQAKRSGRDSLGGAYRAEVPMPQAKRRRQQAEAREGWWSRGLLGEADHFPVGKTSGPKARRPGTRRQCLKARGRTAENTEGAKAGQRPVGKTGGHKKTPTFLRVFRVRTGRFELPTSCLSSKRSKPTELSPRRLGLQR